MDTLDHSSVDGYFRRVCDTFPCSKKVKTVLVTHILPDRPFQINALSRISEIAIIFAKPKSIHQNTKNWLQHQFDIISLRERFTNGNEINDILSRYCNNEDIVIFDIGGYFSKVGNYIFNNYPGRLLGIIEDTENGRRMYEREADLRYPVVSVARSPLKSPEDFLVGQSIVFSTEALLREQGDILHGRTACVLGYGRLGRSIANLLHARHVNTVVFDTNPVRCVEAMSHGFSIAGSLKQAVAGAGLVFCATGAFSLGEKDFELLENGAYIATVTSSDDELNLNGIKSNYRARQTSDFITKYEGRNKHFFLMNRGQAVNFIHGAAVGPFIYLVQAEMLASVSGLISGAYGPGISENNDSVREEIASIWIKSFGAVRGKRNNDN